MKRSIVWVFVFWLAASPSFAQEVVREFSWSELKRAGKLSVGTVEPGGASGPRERLRIDSPVRQGKGDGRGGWRTTVTVLDLKNPPVTKSYYVFEGSIRYKDVKGLSVIVVGASLPDGKKYWGPGVGFGKLDAKKSAGPVPIVQGTSDWKPFTLWFNKDIAERSPEAFPSRITLEVQFAGEGTVFLGPVRLREYDTASFERLVYPARPPQPAKPWWTDEDAGWIGGIGGSIVGLLGAVIGTLGGLGKARRFVVALTATLVGAGVLSLIVGLIALALGQPYPVYYPLLLLGIILTAVCGGNLPMLRRRYQQIELRKMAAMDAR
jgi:hypothetical protein